MAEAIVIYHAGCADGIGAAWSFYRKFGGDVKCYAAGDRILANDKGMPDLHDKIVYIVDYSYSQKELDYIHSIAKSVAVIDHHKSAIENLAGWENGGTKLVSLDDSKCATELAWEFVWQNDPRPWFIKHIRDRDLWLWEHPDSRAFGAMFHRAGYSFKTLDNLFAMDVNERKQFIDSGRAIVENESAVVQQLEKCAEKATFAGYTVWAVNTPIFRSEIGNSLAMRNDADFAVIYRYNIERGCWWISLRGDRDDIELNALAAGYPEGGGHPYAAGFTWPGDIDDIIRFKK